MITRKENLLVRPFQHRNYVQHRQKVITALPRIDDVTPPKRSHVYVKCKKIQTEAERHAQIERDNFILLKHLNDIMHIKRVDNCWLYEHPKFLQRIKLFHQPSTMPFDDEIDQMEFPKTGTKKERCIACHPENYVKREKIPEERVPWEMRPVREFYSADSFQRHREGINLIYTRRQKVLIKEKSQPIINHRRSETHEQSPIKGRRLPHKSLQNKNRSSTAPPLRSQFTKHNLKSSLCKEKSQDEALTVIIKFPPKSQVNLNAGISDQIT
ncbi:uncharacterized protein LOC135832651 [Planococcus citri]|uniref:uncharacterized protein LOC135832651 n=1 Tax=Planococcus citri TaxID=170843 RepID=UPI0031F7CF49